MLLFKILKQVFFNCLNLKLNSILLYYIPFCFKWKLLIQLQFIDRQNNTVHRILKQFFSSPEGTSKTLLVENFMLAKLYILVKPTSIFAKCPRFRWSTASVPRAFYRNIFNTRFRPHSNFNSYT